MIVATDLEGVLIPEIWVEVARATGVDGLAATTRDEPDFARLMDRRVELLGRHDIRLPALQAITADLMPYPGASELLAWYRTKGQVIIISDSFHELSDAIVRRMGGCALFANAFETDTEGRVLGHRLRIGGRKERLVRPLAETGFHVIAIGDGYNDVGMFRAAQSAILYGAPEDLAERIPEGHRASTFDDLRRIVTEIHRGLSTGRSQPV